MLISVTCPHCEAMLEIVSTRAHKDMECPQCGGLFDPPDRPIGVGDVLGGYQIKRLLGKGGMGQVFLANQISMDRDVALKVLDAKTFTNPKLVDRFINEVKISARLEHPNIVRAYDAGEDDGMYYMAMGYVEGQALDEYMHEHGAFGERDALRIVRGVAVALSFAWDQLKMLHRDIKPGNIMLNEHLEPKLLDMGLSKSADKSQVGAAMTVADMVIGTPNYMAPEQADGKKEIATQADMYGLGSTLYHMLTNKLPFEGDGVVEILRKQATEYLPDPRSMEGVEVSDGCVALLEIMMAKQPGERHQDWEALIEDIDRVLAGKKPRAAKAFEPGESVMVRARNQRELASGRTPVLLREQEASGSRWLWPVVGLGTAGTLLMGLVIFLRGGESPVEAGGGGEVPSLQDPDSPDVPDRPVPVLDAAAQARARLREAIEAVRVALEREPVKPRHMVRLRELEQRAEGTDLQPEVQALIAAFRQRMEHEVAARLDALEVEIQPLLEQHQYDEAMAVMGDYSGVLARATQSARQQRVAELAQAKQEYEDAELVRHEAALERYNTLLEHVIDDMVNMRHAEARSRYETARLDEAFTLLPVEMEELQELVGMVALLRETLLASLREQVGTVQQIEFVDGVAEVRLVSVQDDGTVVAREFFVEEGVHQGSAPRRFRLSDLSSKEKMGRLGSEVTPEQDIMRGLVACELKAWSIVKRYLERADNRSARLLRRHAALR